MKIVFSTVFESGALLEIVHEQLQKCDFRPIELILDISNISMLHSPLLGDIVSIYTHVQRRNTELIVTGANPFNQTVLKHTQLDKLFSVA